MRLRINGASCSCHYNDVIMGAIASQITSLTIVYSIVYSEADNKHQSFASLAFVLRIHRGPVNSPHKWPVTRKMFPFDDVIMWIRGVTRSNRLAMRLQDSQRHTSPGPWMIFIAMSVCESKRESRILKDACRFIPESTLNDKATVYRVTARYHA